LKPIEQALSYRTAKGLYLTYKELKHSPGDDDIRGQGSLYLTYKELKLKSLYITYSHFPVYILPIRN
jgi:hypothetical protein